MAKNMVKNEETERTAKINRVVKISSLVFVIATIIHMYLFEKDWSFITNFFKADPLPWIMLGFLSLIVYFFYGTYMYFRKHL